MKTQIQVDTKNASQIQEAVKPSLRTTDTVSYDLKAGNDSLTVNVDTDGLGPLRGCTDTVFRLLMLSNKIYTRGET
ncbi:MAG: hypothetical protein ABEJ83_01220 [Candidatus Nanohaloarchaea archaeon]